MRQLAARLVRVGFQVLRFDYFGTGDSYGGTGKETLQTGEDIETAIEKLTTAVDLAGLRLGANLSARVAAHRSKEISETLH
jgi:uncharacterized protein